MSNFIYDFLFPLNKYGVNYAGKSDFIEWLLDISNDYPLNFELCENLMYALSFKDFAKLNYFLLSKHFDLFGLIENDLAINAVSER